MTADRTSVDPSDVATGPGGGAAAPPLPSYEVDEDEPNGLFAGPNDEPNRFELLGSGRAGGEGVIWRGRFRGSLQTPVVFAIKQLRAPDGRDAFWPGNDELRRWGDQRHLLQTINNDHVVRVHDVFLGPSPHRIDDGVSPTPGREFTTPYIVMEWIPGLDLRTGVTKGGLDLVTRLEFVRDIADALASLHSATRTSGNPMLHRDVKPENCVLDDHRGAVLVDLGTMRSTADGRDRDGLHTRHYTAPEVLADPHAPRTTATDLYGLGALAYFCIVGADPAASDDRAGVASLIDELRAAARAQGAPRPETFAAHAAAMLASDPRERPSRPLHWATDLLNMATGPVRPRRRLRRRWALATAATLVAGAAGVGVAMANSGTVGGPPATVSGFSPFGTSYVAFPAAVNGDQLSITPPLGDNRYDHLWGFFAPADACATTIEFDATVGDHDPNSGFGYAIAPRAGLADDQPTGLSLQYEWDPATDSAPGSSLVRPAELPGGAWKTSAEPEPMPDVAVPHHVKLTATGTRMKISIDGKSVSYDGPSVECGGVALRSWGAPVTFSHVTISGT